MIRAPHRVATSWSFSCSRVFSGAFQGVCTHFLTLQSPAPLSPEVLCWEPRRLRLSFSSDLGRDVPQLDRELYQFMETREFRMFAHLLPFASVSTLVLFVKGKDKGLPIVVALCSAELLLYRQRGNVMFYPHSPGLHIISKSKAVVCYHKHCCVPSHLWKPGQRYLFPLTSLHIQVAHLSDSTHDPP